MTRSAETAAQSRAEAAGGGAASAAVGQRGAYLLLAAVILLWGANWPIMKVGLQSIPPLWFGVARMTMGAATLFAVLAATGRLVVPRRGDWPVVISVAFLQMAAFLVFVNFALLNVDAGRSAILAYTTPLWVTPAAILFLGERVNARKATGLALGLAGVAVLFNPLGFDWSSRAVVIGNGLLMLAALCWAGAILHVRCHRWISSPLQLAPWQMLVASPLLIVLALVMHRGDPVLWSPELVAILAYNGPIATAFCYWAAVTVTRALPAISTSLGFLGVPVAGMLLAALTLGETLSPTRVGGLVLIVAGMALVNLAEAVFSGRRA